MASGAGGSRGGAGDSPCGAGNGGNGRRRERFAWRRGRFALRRGQRRQRPAARAVRLAARAIRLAARARAATAGCAGRPPGGAGAKPGGYVWKRHGTKPRYTIMVDPAAMAVGGGNANGEAHVAHDVAGDEPDVDRSTDPEMLHQFRPSVLFYAHVGRTEVVDGIPVIADQSLYDVCVRNRARAYTRCIHFAVSCQSSQR